jgi:hypothetical protein
MAILNQGPVSPGARLLAALSAIGITSCALVGVLDGGDGRMAFSHSVHVEEGLDCGDCHMGIEDSNEPGMPSMAGCMLCHESMEDEDTPPAKRLATLFDEEGRYLARSLSRLPEETVFSHLRHVTEGALDCAACHGEIETTDSVLASVEVSMDECMACHTEQSRPNECTTCHTLYAVDRAPPTHSQNWMRIHGSISRARLEDRVQDCSMCHTEQSCQACHQETQPASHTNQFRLRGHGIQASIDRDSCAACHRTESCDRCHQETRPLSHSGSWGGARSTHCVGCHEPLLTGSCATCHKQTPSHRMAAPKPADHVASMNCRLCHGLGAPLPHVDNGSDCNSCHR